MHILLLSACGVKTHVLLLPFCIAMFLFARFKPVWHSVSFARHSFSFGSLSIPFTMISNVFKYLYYNIFLSCLFSVFIQQTITTTPLFFSIQLFQGAISLLHIFLPRCFIIPSCSASFMGIRSPILFCLICTIISST